MQETYRSNCYAPDKVVKRYVRYNYSGTYKVVEANAESYSIRELDAAPADIPQEIRDGALAVRNRFPAYVEWPL